MKVSTTIKAALAAFLTGVIAVLLFVISATVRTRSRVVPNGKESTKREDVIDEKFNQKAEAERFEGEDALRARTPGDVAHEYDGVGRAVDDGRNRFASRAKNRILAAGGRRVDEQHID